MNIEDFRDYCLAKKAVEETFPFDEVTLVFKVLGKMFALTGLEREEFTVNLKCDPEYAMELREEYPDIQPGFHMSKKHWNTVHFESELDDKMLRSLIDHSYDMVVKKMKKADREFLENKKIMIIDQQHKGASSKVAAGLINPITGRRFVKSWMIDDLLPIAIKTYQQFEKDLGISILHARNIYRALIDPGSENDWTLRKTYPEFTKYMGAQLEPSNFPKGITKPHQIGEQLRSLQIDIPQLISSFFQKQKEQNNIQSNAFEYDQLEITDSGVNYQNIKAKQIVFCEGHRAIHNPWFNYLPFVLAKGEVLIINAPKLGLNNIYKNQTTIAPLGNDFYWIGSTYDWKFENDAPTKEGKEKLLHQVQQDINVSFEVIKHQAAIRPTVKDRRPFLGNHPEFYQLSIFNGLGTKGASLGPYWAKKMVDFLLNKNPLQKDINIERFSVKK